MEIIGYKKGEINSTLAKSFINKTIESLKSANICFDNGYYNTCVSRSYYAVYQNLIAILVYYGKYDPKSNTHEKVIGDFNKHYGKKLAKKSFYFKVNQKILLLKNERIFADYSSIVTLEERARVSLGLAVQILEFLGDNFEEGSKC